MQKYNNLFIWANNFPIFIVKKGGITHYRPSRIPFLAISKVPYRMSTIHKIHKKCPFTDLHTPARGSPRKASVEDRRAGVEYHPIRSIRYAVHARSREARRQRSGHRGAQPVALRQSSIIRRHRDTLRPNAVARGVGIRCRSGAFPLR